MKTLHLQPNTLFLIIFDFAFDLNCILAINVKIGSTSVKKLKECFVLQVVKEIRNNIDFDL